MARPKKVVEYGDHRIEVVPHPVKWMNTTFHEARCVCGGYLRAVTPEGAEMTGKRHTDEPDVAYPSVIFDLKK